ncbi:stomatin-like protein 2, mitochondrial [Rhincodon typus]|uniref:stomatin-like protein 2, mitochondrial n=1 Tax=Rhincodon typus TaxID=259920 RepID=UPI00202E73BD|nr:stomatin-like protein 2, mitochondrial [Rhincodon typus]
MVLDGLDMDKMFSILSQLKQVGLNFLIPIVDRIRYVQSLKEIVIDIPEQSAVSLDNVTLQIDGVLYLRIIDPYKASYGVEDPEYAVTQLAQTTMRSELGKLTLDSVFRAKGPLLYCVIVYGEANAVIAKAKAKAEAIQMLSEVLSQQYGSQAASLSVAEQYVSAFSNLAKESNTILLPANTGDISSMVTQAMGIYHTLTNKPETTKEELAMDAYHADRSPPLVGESQTFPSENEVLKSKIM